MQQINYYSLAGHLMTCEGFISANDAQPVDKKNRYIRHNHYEHDATIIKIIASQVRHKHLYCILGVLL